MIKQFDFNLFAVLARLLETKSVTVTARRLEMSQPWVSRALARLRAAFGNPLLVRTNSGMELTLRAEELVAPVQQWLVSTSGLLQSPDFDPARLERRFRVASTDFGVLAVLSPALAEFTAAAPMASMSSIRHASGWATRF